MISIEFVAVVTAHTAVPCPDFYRNFLRPSTETCDILQYCLLCQGLDEAVPRPERADRPALVVDQRAVLLFGELSVS